MTGRERSPPQIPGRQTRGSRGATGLRRGATRAAPGLGKEAVGKRVVFLLSDLVRRVKVRPRRLGQTGGVSRRVLPNTRRLTPPVTARMRGPPGLNLSIRRANLRRPVRQGRPLVVRKQVWRLPLQE